MSEQTLLEDAGIQITTARLIARGQTFAISNITSVRVERGGSVSWAVVWLALALIMLAGGGFSAETAWGLIVLGALGGGLLYRALGRRIVINTSGKDAVAYTTRDRAHAARIVQALNEAIGRR